MHQQNRSARSTGMWSSHAYEQHMKSKGKQRADSPRNGHLKGKGKQRVERSPHGSHNSNSWPSRRTLGSRISERLEGLFH